MISNAMFHQHRPIITVTFKGTMRLNFMPKAENELSKNSDSALCTKNKTMAPLHMATQTV